MIKNLYKEVRFKNNWITDGEIDAMLSEPKPWPPPEGMKPAPEGALRKALRVKPQNWMTSINELIGKTVLFITQALIIQIKT